ncbi:MAG: TetR/AcrR family transcriptional regulator [Acidimicrobiia bacterium]
MTDLRTDPRAGRREARRSSIVAQAWSIARTGGFGDLSLHALARAVGIRQPSLYAYFDSKHALFDAMFADGNRKLLERVDALELPRSPLQALKTFMAEFAAFCVEDTARAQLMFQRPIPGYQPSAESYELAQQFLDRVLSLLAAVGVDQPDDIDCFIAAVAGLVDAQVSNDPGGDRWVRHLDRVIDMVVSDTRKRRRQS